MSKFRVFSVQTAGNVTSYKNRKGRVIDSKSFFISLYFPQQWPSVEEKLMFTIFNDAESKNVIKKLEVVMPSIYLHTILIAILTGHTYVWSVISA